MVNQDEPENMIVVVRWQSRKHYDAYLAWRKETGVVKQFADATEGGLSIRFFDVIDVVSLAEETGWAGRLRDERGGRGVMS